MDDFDAEAATWESNPGHLERTSAIARAIRSLVPLSRTMRALEVGCGTGLLSFALHDDLGTVVATDPSQGMIDVLVAKIEAAKAENIQALRVDLGKEPIPGSFHLVFLQMALHHIPDVEGFLLSAWESLEEGGWLCIADLDSEDGSFHGFDTEGIHPGFDRPDLVRDVQGAGFHVVDIDTVFEIQRESDGRERRYPIFLLVARKA
jgi:2-polyprenyl-3-methyl-5-hydroxy-6-metoxy-1,4-benzoquinol methylase